MQSTQTLATDPPATPPRRRLRLVLGCAVLVILGGLLALKLLGNKADLVRPRIAEMLAAASACKEEIGEAYEKAGSGSAPSGKFLCSADTAGRHARMAVDGHGTIVLTAQGFGRDEVDGRTLLLVPYQDDATPKDARLAAHRGPVHKWVCRSPDVNGIPERFLPATCR